MQDELGLNTTAMDYRQYDGAKGRFDSMDVLAELFPDESSYGFSFNNPVFFSDPTGLCPECEKNVKNPTAGQSYTSTGGATYVYNNGQWTQEGGQLGEVTVTATAKKKSSDVKAGKKESSGNTRLFGLIQNANVNSEGESPLEEYRGRRDDPGYLPGEDKFDRIFRMMNSSHIEQMQDFGGGGHNMFGGYGRAIRATGQGYSSFNAFKRANGAAGKGMAWHHIVEQHASNILKFGAEKIHNTNNIIKVENGAGSLHAKVTGHYNSLMPGTSMRVRDYVKTLGYGEQYQYGIETLKRFGWKP